MSWSPYDGRLEFRVAPSRGLAALCLSGHLLAGLAIGLAGLGAWLLAPLGLSLYLALRMAWQPLGRGTLAIAWSAAGGWARVGLSSNREAMELRGSSVVTNAAMFLHWEAAGATWRILLCRDAMQSDDWRRMRVIAGLYEGRARMPAAASIATPTGRTLGSAPGQTEWRMDSPGFRGARPDGHEEQRPAAGREGPAG